MKESRSTYRVLISFVLPLIMTILSSELTAANQAKTDLLEGFFLVEKNDFLTGQWPLLVSGAHYHYPVAEIPHEMVAEDDPARHVVYSKDAVRLHFKGMDPEARFKLRVVCLSNTVDRVFDLMAGDRILQKEIALSFGKKAEYVIGLPRSTYQDENVEIKVINRGGVNAVLSSIELWSDKEKPFLYLEPSAAGDFYGLISGLVKDAQGNAVAGASIEIKLEDTEQVFTTVSDTKGRFSFTALQQWRKLSDKWIHISAIKGKLHGHQIIPMMEVFMPRLTPKPHWVKGAEKTQIDLNGVWHFNPKAPPNTPEPYINLNDWAQIEVPGEWMMQGFTVEEGKPAAYRRQIAIPPDWQDHRIKIRFDAVFSKTQIWLNGKLVGSHMGTFTPFEVDVTEAALPGKMNMLAMEVTSESLAETLTSGKLMVGYQSGGIIRSVSVFAVPNLNIASFHVGTTFDKNYRNATIEVLLEIANEGPEDVKKVTADFTLTEATAMSKQVKIRPKSFKLAKSVKAGETINRTIKIPVKSPKQWNAENPNLYVLDCTLNAGGEAIENTQQRFGFRQLEIRGHQVFLNGRPIRLRGASRQDSHPLMGRTVPAEVHRRDMELMVWANINNTYTCAFSPDEEVLNLADEMGLYMMEEPCTCWVSGLYMNDPKFYPDLLRPVLEMIQRSRSHPCVLTWMLADESAFGTNFQKVLEKVRALDPSRPVHFAWDPGGDIFDLGSMHYPGYSGLATAANSKRPFIFDQYCSAYLNVSELLTDPGIRDEWAYNFAPFWEAIWKTSSMWGAQVFNFQDDVFLMPSGDVLGCGPWGVIDYWRRPKPELWHIKKAYSPVKIKDETKPLPVPEPGESIRIEVENRYDFTNLNELLIEWALGDESRAVQVDVSPHSTGMISIRPENKHHEGKELSLRFYRKGLMVDAYKLSIGQPSGVEQPVSETSGALQLFETDEEVRIKGKDFSLIFDRHAGQIRQATVKGYTVLIGGPMLMLLPEGPGVFSSGFPDPKPAESPFNETCHDWKVDKVTTSQSVDGVEIVVEGHYREADGQYRLHVDGAGTMSIDYQFTTKVEIFARQIGIVLYVPKSFDSLAWKRKGLWSVYPDDHIGRLEGVAKAFRDASLPPDAKYREKPPWPWYLDSNALGTRDFRATRRDILRASLMDAAGRGIVLRSDGTQHTRAFVDDKRIGILIADYSVGGLGQLPWELLRLEKSRNPVSKGTSLKGTVRIVCEAR